MGEETIAAGGARLLHGLVLSGDVPIAAAVEAPAGSTPDFVVRELPAAPVPDGPPNGEPVAGLEVPGTHYDAAFDGDRLRIRFFGTARFDVDLAAGTIDACPVPGREGMLPILLGGSVLALVLGLAGEPVLHASAVVSGDACIAVVGPSGSGKSTVAFLLCRAGLPLLTDDTARLSGEGGATAIHRGSPELRLRGPIGEAARGSGWEHRDTADDRVAVAPPAAGEPLVRLGVIVAPAWTDSASVPSARILGERETLEVLLRSPRVAGWVAPEPLRTSFTSHAELAASVGALRLEVPRSRLEDPSLATEVAGALAGALGSGGAE